MKSLDSIRAAIASGEFELTRHALHRMVERNITAPEIEEAGSSAEIIELYPDDKYSPSALLLGYTDIGRPLHIQVSLVDSLRTKIITLYEPDLEIWIGNRERR